MTPSSRVGGNDIWSLLQRLTANMRSIIMIFGPEFDILRFQNEWLKSIRDSIRVDWVICPGANIEQGIKTAI